MRAVAVHVDALHVLGVDVAGDMVAAVDDQAGLAELGGLVTEHRRRDACADNQIIIMGQLHNITSLYAYISIGKAVARKRFVLEQ